MKRLERGLLIHPTCLLSLSPLRRLRVELLGVEATPDGTRVETGFGPSRPLAVLEDTVTLLTGLAPEASLMVVPGKAPPTGNMMV